MLALQADLEKQGLSKRTAKLLSDAVTAAKALPLDVLLQGLGIRLAQFFCESVQVRLLPR